jgi:hypothetical protein
MPNCWSCSYDVADPCLSLLWDDVACILFVWDETLAELASRKALQDPVGLLDFSCSAQQELAGTENLLLPPSRNIRPWIVQTQGITVRGNDFYTPQFTLPTNSPPTHQPHSILSYPSRTLYFFGTKFEPSRTLYFGTEGVAGSCRKSNKLCWVLQASGRQPTDTPTYKLTLSKDQHRPPAGWRLMVKVHGLVLLMWTSTSSTRTWHEEWKTRDVTRTGRRTHLRNTVTIHNVRKEINQAVKDKQKFRT